MVKRWAAAAQIMNEARWISKTAVLPLPRFGTACSPPPQTSVDQPFILLGSLGPPLEPVEGQEAEQCHEEDLESQQSQRGHRVHTPTRLADHHPVLGAVHDCHRLVLSDRGLEEHYGSLSDRWARWLLLSGALVVGWISAALSR
jgi:hypothetical protein